ncbi:MAG: choice-of-anchor D domain-containing protein [Bacteriovoracaceae bacterium]|nr:choice-of-anchor D domain-containing protein [Bacteriovoracaceae bacterium]
MGKKRLIVLFLFFGMIVVSCLYFMIGHETRRDFDNEFVLRFKTIIRGEILHFFHKSDENVSKTNAGKNRKRQSGKVTQKNHDGGISPMSNKNLTGNIHTKNFGDNQLLKKNKRMPASRTTPSQVLALLQFSKDQNMKSQALRGSDYERLKDDPKTPKGTGIELIGVDSESKRPIFYKTHNLESARTINVANLWNHATWNDGSIPTYGVDGGNGITFLAQWDEAKVSTSHIELGANVTNESGESYSTHATHVAGTMVAGGVGNYSGDVGYIPGMAYGGYLYAYDWTNDLSEIAVAAASADGLAHGSASSDILRVSNHSYGLVLGWYYNSDDYWYWLGDTSISTTEDSLYGFYNNNAMNLDNIAYMAPHWLGIWAAGNDRSMEGPGGSVYPAENWYEWDEASSEWVLKSGTPPPAIAANDSGYDTIGPEGTAKNLITVGAVSKSAEYVSELSVVMSEFSGWGPTDDGRIKPDVVAAGVDIWSTYYDEASYAALSSGTSMAAPSVAGGAALLQKIYSNYNNGDYANASTIKALIIHSAREAGSFAGPDYAYGWGLPDFDAAANLIYVDNGDGTCVREEILSDGENYMLSVRTTGEPVKLTIVWTDPHGPSISDSLDPSTQILVDDLNMNIVDDNGNTHYPWRLDVSNPHNAATRGVNSVDNVEKIEVATTIYANKIWTINVTHTGSLSEQRPYSLVFEGLDIPESDISFVKSTSGAVLEKNQSGSYYLDMGNTLDTVTKQEDILIVNSGLQDLVLSNFSIDSSSFSYSIDETSIPASSSATLSVYYIPGGYVGTKEATINFNTNFAELSDVSIYLVAVSTQAPSSSVRLEHIAPDSSVNWIDGNGTHTLPDVQEDSTVQTQYINITNDGNADLAVSNFAALSSPFLWSGGTPSDATISPQETIQLPFTLDTGTVGTYTQDVTFSTNDESGGNSFTVNLVGTVTEIPCAEIKVEDGATVIVSGQSTPVSMGSIDVGNYTTKTFTVTNNGNAEMLLDDFITDGSQFTWTKVPSSIPAGGSDTITIKFMSYVAASFEKTASFSWGVSGGTMNTFTILLSGQTNAYPVTSIKHDGQDVTNGTSVVTNLATVEEKDLFGASNSHVFTFHNDGNANLMISNLVIPTGFRVLAFPSAYVVPGGSTELKLGLYSTVMGPKSGNVTFNTNESGANASFSFPISGEITGAKLTVSHKVYGVFQNEHYITLLNTGYNTVMTVSGASSTPLGFILEQAGSSTITAGSSSTWKFVVDDSYSGIRSGSVNFTTNAYNQENYSLTITGGNPDEIQDINPDGTTTLEEEGLSNNGMKTGSAMGCGTINIDDNNNPTGGIFVTVFGFLLVIFLRNAYQKVRVVADFWNI